MKVIIPAAGIGTRLRPHTYTMPKPLIPVAGKTIIGFIIERFLRVGVDEFVFVLGYMSELVIEYLEQEYPNISKEYVIQHSRLGIGHAIWTAKDTFADEDQIFINLGDTILEMDVEALIQAEHSGIAIKKVKDPRSFGVVEVDNQGNIVKMIEKPNIPKSNQAIVGLYKITDVPQFIKSLDHHIDNEIKTQNEYHLTDVLMHMLNRGHIFRTHEVTNWYDCGQKDILIETNRVLLKRYGGNDKSYTGDNCIIIEPVALGKNCLLENAIIGPYVTIANNAVIKNSVIENSILGNYSSISNLVLQESLIGNDAIIEGKARKLNIGDNNEMELG